MCPFILSFPLFVIVSSSEFEYEKVIQTPASCLESPFACSPPFEHNVRC